MATDLQEDRLAVSEAFIEVHGWQVLGDNVYRCRILISPEADGGYSAHALRLPGVVSQGESIDEAIDNVTSAFQAAVEEYLSDPGEIPWSDIDVERTKGCVEKWILVHV